MYLYVNNPDFFEIKNKNACRIGITMDLERRKKEWERRYLTEGKVIKNWTVLALTNQNPVDTVGGGYVVHKSAIKYK